MPKFPNDMNISAIFNVGDFTPSIKDADEGNEDWRVNPTTSITSKPRWALGLYHF